MCFFDQKPSSVAVHSLSQESVEFEVCDPDRTPCAALSTANGDVDGTLKVYGFSHSPRTNSVRLSVDGVTDTAAYTGTMGAVDSGQGYVIGSNHLNRYAPAEVTPSASKRAALPDRVRVEAGGNGPNSAPRIPFNNGASPGELGGWAPAHARPAEWGSVRGCGRPEDGDVRTAKTVKRPPQQPAQPPIRQLLGAAIAQTAHPATSSTAPAHQPLGSANVETTPARAPAAAADRTQRPDATCEGKNG